MSHYKKAVTTHGYICTGRTHSREVQISYYLEGEMAVFCLDAELRKRSKGKHGMDDVMATLYHNHKLDSNNPESLIRISRKR